MKNIVFIITAITFIVGSSHSVRAQNGSVHTATVKYAPSQGVNGYEVDISFKYQFIWCVDAIKCVVSMQDEKALAYYYDGKRLTNSDVSRFGGFKSARKARSGEMNISAKLMQGNVASSATCDGMSSVRLTNLIYAWGGCLGDTHSFFCDKKKEKEIKDNKGLVIFSLTNFSVDTKVKYIDYDLESKMKKEKDDAKKEEEKRKEEDRKNEESKLKMAEEERKQQESRSTTSNTSPTSSNTNRTTTSYNYNNNTSSGTSSVSSTRSSTSSSSSTQSSAATRQAKIDAEHREMMRKQRAEEERKKSDLKAANIAANNRKLQQSQNNLNKAWDNFGNALVSINRQNAANEAAAERRRRERLAAEEAASEERLAEEARIVAEAKRKAEITEMRDDLIIKYKDSGMPRLSDRITTNDVYYFAYRVNRSSLNNEKPQIYVTNVFPIGKYLDDSWPLTNNIKKEITDKGGNGDLVLVGYFETEALALQARRDFVSTANRSEVQTLDMEYSGKKSKRGTQNENTSNDDFWERDTSKEKTTENKKAQTKKNAKESTKSSFWD